MHVIFSTKDRRPMITREVESQLHAYIGGTAKNLDSPCLAIGGTNNHVYLLISQSKKIALSRLMEEVKTRRVPRNGLKPRAQCSGPSAGKMDTELSPLANRRRRLGRLTSRGKKKGTRS